MARVTYARQVHRRRDGAAPMWRIRSSVDIPSRPSVGALAIFTADCRLSSSTIPTRRVLGVAHVGWRGTVRGATPAASRSRRLVARAAALRVAIAPSIVRAATRGRAGHRGSSARW